MNKFIFTYICDSGGETFPDNFKAEISCAGDCDVEHLLEAFKYLLLSSSFTPGIVENIEYNNKK